MQHDHSDDEGNSSYANDAAARADREVIRRSIHTGTIATAGNQAALVKQYTEAEECYLSWKAGVTHPDDDLYVAIWNGEMPGLSEKHVETRLAKQKRIYDEITSGEKTPSEIVGSVAYGNTPDMILRNLARGISEFEEAVRSQGRNLSINQARVKQVKAARENR